VPACSSHLGYAVEAFDLGEQFNGGGRISDSSIDLDDHAIEPLAAVQDAQGLAVFQFTQGAQGSNATRGHRQIQ
jgi:hypothetical protein